MRCCSRRGRGQQQPHHGGPARRASGSTITTLTFKSGGNESSAVVPDLELQGLPPFDAVLEGSKQMPFPWVPENFLDFLIGEVNEENFFFYHEVNALKCLKSGDGSVKTMPDERFLYLEKDVHTEPRYGELVQRMLDTFVRERAEKQVNISHEQRERLLKSVDASPRTSEVDPGVFTEAQKEVFKLMKQDSYPRFARRNVSENITEWDRKIRLRKAIVALAIIILIAGLIIGLQANRFIMFIELIPCMAAMDMFIAYKTRLCIMHAYRELKDLEATETVCRVECPIVKRMTKHRAKKQFVLTVVLGALLAGALFGLTYAFY